MSAITSLFRLTNDLYDIGGLNVEVFVDSITIEDGDNTVVEVFFPTPGDTNPYVTIPHHDYGQAKDRVDLERALDVLKIVKEWVENASTYETR